MKKAVLGMSAFVMALAGGDRNNPCGQQSGYDSNISK